MERRTEFTREEMELIRELLRSKGTTSRYDQKKVRSRLRRIGFNISDFGAESSFGEADLDILIKNGRVRVKA